MHCGVYDKGRGGFLFPRKRPGHNRVYKKISASRVILNSHLAPSPRYPIARKMYLSKGPLNFGDMRMHDGRVVGAPILARLVRNLADTALCALG